MVTRVTAQKPATKVRGAKKACKEPVRCGGWHAWAARGAHEQGRHGLAAYGLCVQSDDDCGFRSKARHPTKTSPNACKTACYGIRALCSAPLKMRRVLPGSGIPTSAWPIIWCVRSCPEPQPKTSKSASGSPGGAVHGASGSQSSPVAVSSGRALQGRLGAHGAHPPLHCRRNCADRRYQLLMDGAPPPPVRPRRLHPYGGLDGAEDWFEEALLKPLTKLAVKALGIAGEALLGPLTWWQIRKRALKKG